MSALRTRMGSWLKTLGRAGLMVWAILFGSALILSAVYFIVQQEIAHEREQAFASAADINSKIALSDEVRIRSLLASLDKVLLVLRKDFAGNPKLTQQELTLRMDELKVESELNPRISFVNASGDVQLASARDINGEGVKFNVSDRAYFQKQKTELDDVLDAGMPFQSRISGHWIVPLTRRLTNKDGSFGGTISMMVDPVLFTEPFEKTSVGPNASRRLSAWMATPFCA